MDVFSLSWTQDDQWQRYCLADIATTHAIFKDKIYFVHLIICEARVYTIFGNTKLVEDSGRANKVLPRETKSIINNALFTISLKDIY